MIKAIIFDFDGLVLDTETHQYLAHREIFLEHNTDLAIEVWGICVGTVGNFDPWEHLEKCIGKPVDRVALTARCEEKFRRVVANEEARPGVTAYLQTAESLGLKIGLASSSTRQWVESFLDKLGLLAYFDCLCTSDDVSKVKPDPELYNLALKRLGVKPNEVIAFEDSAHGAVAAKNAGLHCVIVPNAVTETFAFPPVDLRLASMSDLTLSQVLTKFNG